MDIKELFGFLVKQYGLTYVYQDFKNCFDGNWQVYTHSFYNESGCFTIHNLPQRGELDFYYAKKFSNNRKDLCEKMIDIRSAEEEIWKKHSNVLGIRNPFFWWSEKKVLSTLVEVIKSQIKKKGEFFGIEIKNIK